MIRRLILIGALAAGLVASSFSAAPAATISTDTWAPKFCNAITHYEQTIQTKSSSLQTDLGSSTNLKVVRTKLVVFLGAMQKAAATAKRQIQSAGSPSATNGDKINARFVAALDKSADIFSKAQAQAAKVSTSSPTAFEKQATKIGSDLEKAGRSLNSEFSNIKQLDTGQQVQTSLQSAPECASLNSSTATTTTVP